MTFCLNTTIVKPEEGEEIKNAVILLHGYGGDGKDISMLTLNWKRFLKNTVFQYTTRKPLPIFVRFVTPPPPTFWPKKSTFRGGGGTS